MDFNNEHTSIILGRIISRSISGNLTPEEQAALDDWLKSERNQQIYADIRNGAPVGESLSMFDGFDAGDGYRRFQASVAPQQKRFRLRPWMAAAAAIALVLTVSVLLYRSAEQANQPVQWAADNGHDIPPGGNRATLTFADGRTITLDEARDGIVIDGDEVTYNDGNPLTEVGATDQRDLLGLSTPKGGTYQVTLSDGTRVWLNAASTMKYPSQFTGKERVVELTGEAYFAVVKDANRPFKVVSAGQEVEVLGTEFNISAYPDNAEAKTTLVAGKVRLSKFGGPMGTAGGGNSYLELVPGEQGIIMGNNLAKAYVDTALYTAWKSGYFYFKRTPVDEILRQVARWYDVEIVYEGEIPGETLSGDIKRNVSLRGLLDILQHAKINVSLKGRTLTVHR